MKDIIQRARPGIRFLKLDKCSWPCPRHCTRLTRWLLENRFKMYLDRYMYFLNEKTINPVTEASEFTHKDLRQAVMSLIRFMPYLFTYENDKEHSQNTNSLEGPLLPHQRHTFHPQRNEETFKRKSSRSIILLKFKYVLKKEKSKKLEKKCHDIWVLCRKSAVIHYGSYLLLQNLRKRKALSYTHFHLTETLKRQSFLKWD